LAEGCKLYPSFDLHDLELNLATFLVKSLEGDIAPEAIQYKKIVPGVTGIVCPKPGC